MNREIRIYPDTIQLNRALADRVVSISEKAIAARGRFVIGLSGGNTPRAAYELMATPEYVSLIDWQNSYIFWGDERCVPPDSPDSNARMARETLLNFVPVPVNHIYRIHGEAGAEQAAEQYEATLRDFFTHRLGMRSPRFDLLLLGMGADGHTASLFPHTAALNERKRWVVGHYVPNVSAWRVTLTVPALNAAANVIFLTTGSDKADVLKQVLEGPYLPEQFPSQLVQPENGRLTWLLDRSAAARLSSETHA